MTADTARYHPAHFKARSFHDAVARFVSGADDPREYLERCLAVIVRREPEVRAWVCLNESGARAAADASTERYRSGAPLSPIDGMPIGIKDLIETKDMPTQMGSAAFTGNFPKRDSALVRALRDAGAVVLGKTVTTELGGATPGPTRNPFDLARTPGGSSSGSGAAVGAGMVPVTIGTQVGGSVIRPASFCGNFAIKPTLGALNRGERLGFSQGHVGVHAGSLIDMWHVALAIGRRAGGDPGHPGLDGPDLPDLLRPERLVVMETAGWASVDAKTREAFDRILAALAKAGVVVLRRTDSAVIEAFERSIAAASTIMADICNFESRWSDENIFEQAPDKMSPRLVARLERGRQISQDLYRCRLLERESARRHLAALQTLGDAVISLSTPGPAPRWDPAQDSNPLSPRPTGDATFNMPSSILGAPAVSLPLIGIEGLPVGVQLLGQWHSDPQLFGIARWITAHVEPVAID